MTLLQSNVPVILDVTNTERLSSERLAIMALPVPAEGLDAWPVRVIALDPGEPPELEAEAAALAAASGEEPQPEDEGMLEGAAAAQQESAVGDAAEEETAPGDSPAEETDRAAEGERAALDTVDAELEMAPPETDPPAGAEAQPEEERGGPAETGEGEEPTRPVSEP